VFSDIETRTVNDTWEVAIDLLVEESINSIIFVPSTKNSTKITYKQISKCLVLSYLPNDRGSKT